MNRLIKFFLIISFYYSPLFLLMYLEYGNSELFTKIVLIVVILKSQRVEFNNETIKNLREK